MLDTKADNIQQHSKSGDDHLDKSRGQVTSFRVGSYKFASLVPRQACWTAGDGNWSCTCAMTAKAFQAPKSFSTRPFDARSILHTICWPIPTRTTKSCAGSPHRNLARETALSPVLHWVHMLLTFQSHSPTWFHAMRCTRILLNMAWGVACSKHPGPLRLHASSKGMFDHVWGLSIS